MIIDNLPATQTTLHNGGRIAFGPDGKLYVSVGDTAVDDLAQDATRAEGSILRYNPDGSIPSDNPIPGSPVYAIGLRNVFGLAFQPNTGFLYRYRQRPRRLRRGEQDRSRSQLRLAGLYGCNK